MVQQHNETSAPAAARHRHVRQGEGVVRLLNDLNCSVSGKLAGDTRVNSNTSVHDTDLLWRSEAAGPTASRSSYDSDSSTDSAFFVKSRDLAISWLSRFQRCYWTCFVVRNVAGSNPDNPILLTSP